MAEPDAQSNSPAVGETKSASSEPSTPDLTLETCFENSITPEAGATRSQVIERTQMWMWGKQIMEAERGFDEYVRTGRLVEVGLNAHRKPLYKLSERPD